MLRLGKILWKKSLNESSFDDMKIVLKFGNECCFECENRVFFSMLPVSISEGKGYCMPCIKYTKMILVPKCNLPHKFVLKINIHQTGSYA